ncbi:M20/M25/M40 family metallo-hydrolase [Leucobacter aridicollis]|uniref:Acetylornithine deacetylase/succinyl-diaminopimelate desuccinylase-like protein n=1 Tax=Leucobacter aridicollis TaxID=283878 RepID=A0A852R212_9MICO|nr:M20/M25/M40 family metallo-hydrolase [Leucobacter aridicollis]MBL3683734.1 M20/M25/M40 family metallo-hydrolase [Leucobacter aridicollis]NYD26657.1 acetylornithine deacetylase/succinyl-diaminopimelate desuccinylase-like protein [Leucobacter aridicollis]
MATELNVELSETARIARDLIRIDTSNRGEGDANPERPAADYVSAYLRELGLDPVTIESAPGRASVVARVAGREPELPALVLHGHLDVVPADPENWTVDPFAGVVKDGLLWGRGAVDMKDMDAMILTAIAELLRSGERPRRDVILAFFADEENGGVYGSHYLVEHHPDLFAGAGSAISEVGGYSIEIAGQRAYLVQTGEKALDWIRLRARGAAAHGSRVWHDNAVTKLATAVAALGNHEWPIALCDTTRELIDEIAALVGEDPTQINPEEMVLSLGKGAGLIQASLRNTSNPTVLTAGYKHNVIPDTAEALVDVRTLPAERDDVLAKIRELVGPDIEIETVHSDIGLEVPFAGELVEAMKTAIEAHDPGARVLPYLLSGGTDNKALARLGITGYGFAPLRLPADLDFPGMFHGVDERVPLDALDFGHGVLADLLRSY